MELHSISPFVTGVMSSSFPHVLAAVRISILFNVGELYSRVCLYHILFIRPPSMDTWAASTICPTLVVERHEPSVKSSGDQKNSPVPTFKEFTSLASAKVLIQEKLNHSKSSYIMRHLSGHVTRGCGFAKCMA